MNELQVLEKTHFETFAEEKLAKIYYQQFASLSLIKKQAFEYAYRVITLTFLKKCRKNPIFKKHYKKHLQDRDFISNIASFCWFNIEENSYLYGPIITEVFLNVRNAFNKIQKEEDVNAFVEEVIKAMIVYQWNDNNKQHYINQFIQDFRKGTYSDQWEYAITNRIFKEEWEAEEKIQIGEQIWRIVFGILGVLITLAAIASAVSILVLFGLRPTKKDWAISFSFIPIVIVGMIGYILATYKFGQFRNGGSFSTNSNIFEIVNAKIYIGKFEKVGWDLFWFMIGISAQTFSFTYMGIAAGGFNWLIAMFIPAEIFIVITKGLSIFSKYDKIKTIAKKSIESNNNLADEKQKISEDLDMLKHNVNKIYKIQTWNDKEFYYEGHGPVKKQVVYNTLKKGGLVYLDGREVKLAPTGNELLEVKKEA